MNDSLKFRPDHFKEDVRAAHRSKNAIASDCRHYKGDRPCRQNRLCDGCSHYEPYQQRICIIKLGALGDVIRTLCILPTLREYYPDAQITWVSKANGCRMICDHPMIDRTLEFGATTSMILCQEQFDLAINLDKEPEPCALQMTLFARDKRGIGLSKHGTAIPLNDEAHHYFHLGLSDELKFKRNTKSYPQLIHEALALDYCGQSYTLPVDVLRREQFQTLLQFKGWDPQQPTVGINVGASKHFANKMWPVARIVDLIQRLRDIDETVQFLLLGGPDEGIKIDQINSELHRVGLGYSVFNAGTDHDEPSFVAIVDLCDVVFSGDTMAMHVAIALEKQVVAFFGPTCEQEIELFGRGIKLVADVRCAPCYKKHCDHHDLCIDHIPTQRAVAAIEQTLLAVRLKRQLRIMEPNSKAG